MKTDSNLQNDKKIDSARMQSILPCLPDRQVCALCVLSGKNDFACKEIKSN